MRTHNLKYKCEIALLHADLSGFRAQEINCWRFVFDDITDDRNFKPVYLLNIDRFKLDLKTNKATSSGFALSLFESPDAIKAKFIKLSSNKKNFPKLIGKNAAFAKLPYCGLNDDPSTSGHFGLHEFNGIDFAKLFTIDKTILGGDN